MRTLATTLAILTSAWAVCSAQAETGVTDTEIVIGAHTAESGNVAAYSIVPKAMTAYYDQINEKGGIYGRKIKFIREDVQANYQKAADATKKLIESDKIFAMVGGQGQNHVAAYKELASQGVPDLFFIDGVSDYLPFPKTTFAYHHPFAADGRVSGDYIVKNFKGKKACFLIGKALAEDLPKEALKSIEEANKKLPAAQKIKLGVSETIDPQAPQGDTEISRLKADNCDVVTMSLMLPLSANVVNYAASQNFKPQWVVFWWNSIPKFLQLLSEDVPKDKIISTSSIARDETFGASGWKDYVALMDKNKIPVSGGSASGYMVAELFVEALKRTGKDLTREKIVKTVESMGGYKCSLCLSPITVSAKDHWLFKTPFLLNVKDGHWAKM